MNYLVSWYIRVCEFRNAVTRSQATSSVSVSDIKSVLYIWAREFRKGFDQGQTMTEYALILSVVAVVVLGGYQTMGTNLEGMLNTINGFL